MISEIWSQQDRESLGLQGYPECDRFTNRSMKVTFNWFSFSY